MTLGYSYNFCGFVKKRKSSEKTLILCRKAVLTTSVVATIGARTIIGSMLVFLFVLGLLLSKCELGCRGGYWRGRFLDSVILYYLTTAFPCTLSTDMAHMGPYHIILLFRGRGYKDGRCPMVLQCNVPSLRLISGCNIYFCKNKLSTIRNGLLQLTRFTTACLGLQQF